MNEQTISIQLEDIAQVHPNLDIDHLIHCLVALIAENGAHSCSFGVDCRGLPIEWSPKVHPIVLHLSWSQETTERAAQTRDTYHRHHLVEQAAVALACIIFPTLVNLSPLRVAQIGEGVDYWLQGSRYLVEISGTEQRDELERRHRQKVEQLLSGGHNRDGFVIVCCFIEKRIILSFHTR
jgi:hypothetical protein